MSQHSYETFKAGQIPDDFATLSALGKQISCTTRYSVHVLSAIVSKVRRDYFQDNVGEWRVWAQDEFEITPDYIHHIRRIGDMMLMLLDDEKTIAQYKRLWDLDYDRLYSISKIAKVADHQLLPFLSHFPSLAEMTREEVRDEVKRWLGEPITERVVQPLLPGFEQAVEAVLSLDEISLSRAVSNESSATRSMMAGMELLGASLEYHKHAVKIDVQFLGDAKSALLDGVSTIEAAIARALDGDNE